MDINIFDPDYVKNQQTASLQRMAAEQNALRVQQYKQASADWITTNIRNRDIGLPITALPTIPRKIVVTDAGEWTEAPFSELQPPALPLPVAAAGTPWKVGTTDESQHAQVLACLKLIYADLQAIKAKVGA